MKIAICQINTTVGDFEGNKQKILNGMQWARTQGAQMAVFPELAVFGYPPRDLLDRPYMIDRCQRVTSEIAKATDLNFASIFGTVTRNPSPVGRGLFNTAVFAQGGRVIFEQHKTLLPQYDVFDEARHFDSGTDCQTVSFQGRTLGISLCEDIWSSFDFNGRKLYATDPIDKIKEKGADLLINISASPFSTGKSKVRRQLLDAAARKFHFPVVYCNLVGGNDELVFDGRSIVVDATGEICLEAKAFEEDFVIIDLERMTPLRQGCGGQTPKMPDIEEVYQALILGLKDYTAKCGFKKVLLGLSGGIDSALVATLAAEALGAENVLGVLMPSSYSSAGSIDDSLELAKRLGIATRILPIGEIYRDFLKELGMSDQKEITLTHENIQPRVRGTLLMALSNDTGALLLSTGNKSELSCGYCTLYGDMAGGFSLISDLPKTGVYQLCQFINREREIIPKAIVEKAPSAELKPDQKDQDSLPPYEILDMILKYYVEDHLPLEEIIARGVDSDYAQKVTRMIDRNEYKRRQAPPGIKITPKAFGMGRRFPIAWRY